jgi:hypothetical protein
MAIWILGALFLAYVLLTLWQLQRATGATDPHTRLREAMRALIIVSLGVPLLIAFILIVL